MMDDTDLVFASISSYVWCIRTWHQLQHQADPVMGLMDWTPFFTAIAVYTYHATVKSPSKPILHKFSIPVLNVAP